MSNNLSQEELSFVYGSLSRPESATSKELQISPGEMEFAESSLSTPIEKKGEEIPWYKSIPSAALKGFIRGTISLGEMFGGLGGTPEEKSEMQEQREQLIQKQLPSEEGFIEEVAERGSELLPGVASGGGSIAGTLVRSGLAALSGKAAKQLGAGETVEAIAEIPSLGLPGLKKKISPTVKQKEFVEEARRLGLSEEAIAPLMAGEKRQKVLGKFSAKGEKVQERLSKTKQELENLYKDLEFRPEAKNAIPVEDKKDLFRGFAKEFEKIPNDLRKKIAPDFRDLVKGKVTGEKLINFWQDLNYQIRKGESQLGILKKPIIKAMEKVNPEFSKDFQITNQLYGKYAGIRKTLKPNMVSTFMEKAGPYKIVGGLLLGQPWLLKEAAGETVIRKLSTELLLNPRFQNLSKQIVKALNQNKPSIAQNVFNKMLKDVEKVDKDLSEKLKDIDFTEILKIDS